MGWKSTIDITRSEAKELILKRMMVLDALTNEELGDMLMALGYGDDTNLRHFGHNFNVIDDEEL